jgi:hypothetical protein
MLMWLAVAGCALLVVQVALLWHIAGVARRLRHNDVRLVQLGDAVSLLTEATESGFRSVASEVERLSRTGPASAARSVSLRRLTTAASRGRTHAEIAAAEGLSEGEVALRLNLASHAQERAHDGRRRSRSLREASDGAVRPK